MRTTLLVVTLWTSFFTFTYNKEFVTLLPATFDSFKTFEGILQTSTFVDKTNLIKDFITYTKPHAHFLTCPRLFGKTVNIDMLKKFLRLNLNPDGSPMKNGNKHQTPNYKIFCNNLQIFENKTFVNEHFGEYIVISLSMKDILIHDYDIFLKSLYSQLRLQVYDEYLWWYNEQVAIKNSSKNAELHQLQYSIVEKMFSAEYDEEVIADSLKALAEIMHSRFNKEVVLLVDDFDAPIIAAITYRVDVLRISSIIDRMFCNLMKPSQKAIITHILITGIHDTMTLLGSPLSCNFVHHEFSNDHVFARYYGFSEIEVDKLFDFHGASTEEKNKAKAYYRGYMIRDTTKQIFNPFTVISYLHNRASNSINVALRPYWVNSVAIRNLQNSLKSNKIREFIVKLVLHKKISLDLNLASRSAQIKQFKKIINGDQQIGSMELKLFFHYLLEAGYLTYTNKENVYKIPNMEIATHLRYIIQDHYDEYKILNSIEIGEKFEHILQSKTAINKQSIAEYEIFFENQLKTFFRNNSNEFEKPNLNEFEIQAFIYIAAKLSGLNIVRGSYDVANLDPKSKWVKGRADIIIMNDYTEAILIIEIKHNKNVSIATDQVKLYRPLMYKPKTLHLMGFNVNTNFKVEITITTICY